MFPSRAARGFTLIELIVVILVLGILAAIGVVGYAKITERAQDAKAQAHVRQFHTAIKADATLAQAPALSRQVLIGALSEHFPGGVAPGTTAGDGWGLLRVDDPSPDGDTFATGFDTGPGTIASDNPGSRAAVVLHSDSGKSVAAIINWSHSAGGREFCSGYVADGITPRMVLAGSAESGECIDPALLAPPTPGNLRFSVDFTNDGAVLTWDTSRILDKGAPTDGAIEVYRDGEWVATLPAGTETWTDPAGQDGDEYDLKGRPATLPVASSGSARIVWDASEGPVNIYRDGTKIATGDTSGSFIDTASAGDQYVVVLAPAGQERQGLPATVATAPTPSTPGGSPSVNVAADGTFSLLWDAVASTPQAPLTGYRLYRQPEGGTDWGVGALLKVGTATTATDTPGAGTWCYRVSAYGPGGESGLSAPACGAAAVPAKPSAVTPTAADGSATVAWSTAAGATSFTVTASPVGGGQTVSVTVGSGARSATLTGLANGTVYLVSVTAHGPGGATASDPVTVTPGAPVAPVVAATLLASDGAAQDKLGSALAVDGDTAVVAAYLDDDKGADSGSVYVYVRDAQGAWLQQGKLVAADGAASDYFGLSVAVAGDTVVIGAQNDDDKGSNSGSVYVFARTGTVWTQQAKLTAADGLAGDSFGHTVAVEGDTLVASAITDDNARGADAGSAYVFERNGSAWTEQAKLIGADVLPYDNFGAAVALSGDTLVIGAMHAEQKSISTAGAAYVFVRSGSTWTQQAKLVAADAKAFDYFGYAVDISGDTAVISTHRSYSEGTGNGAVYVFVRSGSTWTQQAKLVASDGAFDDLFGSAVALRGDVLAVGAPGDDNAKGADAGSVYLFVRSGTTWTQTKVLAPAGKASDQFGTSVDVVDGGVLVGAINTDLKGSDSGSVLVIPFP